MAPANLAMIPLLALIVWRFVFAGLHRRSLARAIAALRKQRNNVSEQGLHILDWAGVAVIVGNRSENGSQHLVSVARKERAENYLHRIAALTGSRLVGNAYVLDVGEVRFHVRDRHVRRLRDVADPKGGYDGTCFYPLHKGMPEAEEIAAALLQLKNNPALFDKWAVQNGLAFKADGHVFTRPH